MRMPRKFALIAGLAFALGGTFCTLPAAARVVVVDAGVRVAPPPPRFERVPPPRPGFAWAPGYWRWSPRWHRYVWVAGYWMRLRPGYRHYRPARWVHDPHGRWYFHRGYWAH